MKKYILLLLIFLTSTSFGGIVNNSGTSGTDSLSFQFYLLDSIGNNISLASSDSIGLVVFYPNGDEAYALTILGNNGNITETTLSNIGSFYVYADAVANFDGSSASDGVYKWLMIVNDISLGLHTSHSGEFQLYQNSDFNTRLDYLNASISSRSTFNPSTDTVNAYTNIDSTTIARSVWNTPQSSHLIAGTFGDYLDSDISGLGSGSGIYAQSVVVYDTANGQPVSGVNVLIRNLAQSTLIASGNSDVYGYSTFNLNADSFLIVGYAPGYLFEAFDTLVVTGNSVDTIFGYQIDIGNPVEPNLCRVYGYLYGITGLPEVGAGVTAALSTGDVRSGSLIISPFSKSTTTDSLGYFYLDLIPSDSLSPVNQKYEFTISRTDGTVLRQRIEIPALAQWSLSW
ncbi:MAG: hypothetical protein DWP97_06130 [Calditrichaeota bacterium]|nr:MAG: hypothetical protein DWP97_06130 [Calditrichota bacterium]